jgi:hypothetical protein
MMDISFKKTASISHVQKICHMFPDIRISLSKLFFLSLAEQNSKQCELSRRGTIPTVTCTVRGSLVLVECIVI